MAGERYLTPGLPIHSSESALRTLLGTWVKPGGKVVRYVRSTGWTDSDPPDLYNMISTTLNDALAYCRSGYSDIVICLPGHTENITAADTMSNLVAGTRILGMGVGSEQATIRWTNTAATFLLDVANVVIDGMYLKMEGASGVVAPITVSAADCTISNCRIQTASGASNKATTAITVATGAERFKMFGNQVYGTSTHWNTNIVSVTGAVDMPYIADNLVIASVTVAATSAILSFTGAATHIEVIRNKLFNEQTSSTQCIYFANVTCTGFLDDNKVFVLNDSTVTVQGIVFAGANTLVECGLNYCTDEKQKSGVLTPVAGT
jgi:hypothetical protein